MTRSAYLKVGALAALYLFWLATWLVVGNEPYGFGRYYWGQAAAPAVTGIIALYVSRRQPSPYPGFLVIQGFAFLLLAGSWVTYQVSTGSPGVESAPQGASGELFDLLSNALYASCVFLLMCAWGYLALERWQARPLSLLTTLVFAALMAGLGTIYASFYYYKYNTLLDTMTGRLDAVTAALEFAVLATGLLCMLLKEPPIVVWMLVGTVVLMAGDMAYSVVTVPQTIEAVWMLGQFLLLSAVVGMMGAPIRDALAADASTTARSEGSGRSGLSGILILLSLGAVLLSPLVWFLPVDAVWKSFFSVLFIVALVAILVWITDRFDDTVAYLREYVRRVHQSKLVSENWRSARPRIRTALRSTGLDVFLDEFRDSAAQLKQDVLFLGPERLYGSPEDRTEPRTASCFIVMPFSQEWSADVHRILATACEAAGVRPVRGDDLFSPTDILEDIWQSLNAADFVIADITGRNPNVLYELGIAHTLAKPVLILSKEAADIPIDLATRRVILYGQKADAWREDLARMIQEAIAKVVDDYSLESRVSKGQIRS
ncbi:MAG: hypothetical protein WCH75_13610 [Candidatus Binatia bacterium]